MEFTLFLGDIINFKKLKNLFEKMDKLLKEIKKFDPENYPIFKRYVDVALEIHRLQIILSLGTTSKKMDKKIIPKLKDLEKEEIDFNLKVMKKMVEEDRFMDYHENVLKKLKEKKELLEKKHKCKKCKYCEWTIIHEDEGYCPECEIDYELDTDDE